MRFSQASLRSVVISAVMGALALVLPMAFHAAGLGSKFLPMLLPLLINGFLVSADWAVLTGALVPLISALSTGMPPLYPPVVLAVSLEGAVLGGVAALLYRPRRRLWPALATAIICGRLAAWGATWVLARVFSLPPQVASVAMLVQGIPGVLLQLAVVPVVVSQLSRRGGILFAHESRPEA